MVKKVLYAAYLIERRVLLLPMFLASTGLFGCSTMMEVASPYDTSTGYRVKRHDDGRTTVKRRRPLSSSNSSITNIFLDLGSSYKEDSYPDFNSGQSQEILSESKYSSPYRSADYRQSTSLSESDRSLDDAILAELSIGNNVVHGAVLADLNPKSYVGLLGGVSFFNSDRFYGGFEGRLRLRGAAPKDRFFTGVGAYIGDRKTCNYEYDEYYGDTFEVCEKGFLNALFFEAGYQYKKVNLFLRRYAINEEGLELPAATVIGMGFSF
jgi:hypothetical protein